MEELTCHGRAALLLHGDHVSARLEVLVVSAHGAASGTPPDVLAARLAEALSPFSSAPPPCRWRPGDAALRPRSRTCVSPLAPRNKRSLMRSCVSGLTSVKTRSLFALVEAAVSIDCS